MAANGVGAARIVSEDVARMEAERLLSDPRLHVSDRHRAFLKYITDALFEGRSDTVKAYSVAIDVFNRPASFDPSSDPIVRIEATRLRETLQQYYGQISDEPGARLEIPRGRYVPVFVERDHHECPEDNDEALEEAEPLPAASSPSEEPAVFVPWLADRKLRYCVLASVVLAAVTTTGVVAYRAASPVPVDTRKPFVSLSMNAAHDDEAASRVVMEDLAVSLARFGTIRLRSETAAIRSRDTTERNAYDVKLRYAEEPAFVSIWWQVSDAGSGEAVWTDEERRPLSVGSRDDVMRDLVYGVSRRLAGPTGVVNAIELRNNLPAAATGNVCVLRSEFAIEMRDAPGLRAAQGCLQKTIAADPKDVDAMATLARVMLWTGRTTGDASYFGRGLDLANRAATISPSSPRAALAQLATQYQVEQTETAIAAGRRGVVLNPENADLLAKLAMVIFLSGDWQQGAGLAVRAAEIAGGQIREASFVQILDAYRQGHYLQAVSLARQVPAADTPTVVLKLAAIARTGDRAATAREIAAARFQHPDLDRTVVAMFSGTRYDPRLEAALRAGINEAGLNVPELAGTGTK